ncbi:MAG: MFS transporter [Clostridium sp.]|nr:MFS transporter [Clostridium sp.]
MDKKKKILAFISIAIACILTVLDGTIVNVSLPNMAKYFNTDITGISWVSTSYLIFFSALLINFSKIADIYGRKKLFLIGLIIFGTSSILCGLSNSLTMLIIFRGIQGVGAAILTPLAIPLGIEVFGNKALGKLAVIIGMIISASAAAGPVVGGILNEAFGFRSIFYVNVPFILIALILGSGYLIECYDKTIEKKIDIVGTILLAYGLLALTFFIIKGNDYGWGNSKMIALVATSVISIIAFLIYENKVKEPMIEFGIFKTRSFTASIILISVIFFAYMPVSYLMNFYLENNLGYSVLKSGLILGIVSLISIVMSPINAIIAKKISIKVPCTFAVIFVVLGNLTFVFMNSKNNINLIYIAFILMGLGVGATTPLYQSAFEEISKDKNGMASGILNSLRQLTACIAIALIATLSTHYKNVAVDNTKARIINKVNSSIILENQVKDEITNQIKTSDASDASGFSKAKIKSALEYKEKVVLNSTPDKFKPIVMQKFQDQGKEIYNIVDDAKTIKDDETNKVYNKCFLIIGVISAFGIIAVPFNSKKKEKEMYVNDRKDAETI